MRDARSLFTPDRQSVDGMLSVVMPARDEARRVVETVRNLHAALQHAGITHEILVVDDHSRDRTRAAVEQAASEVPTLFCLGSPASAGFGHAVRLGLSRFRGDVVAIVMADGSDSPDDVVAFYRKLEEGYDCVFGSRFMRGSRVIDYPWLKLVLNRLANTLIRLLFWIAYNDTTNAFKMYRRSVVDGLGPLLAYHFNLTVELPLKAIVRGYRYAVLPNTWRNRASGVSKFKIKEMGSRYLFIVLYCLLERYLTRGDFKNRRDPAMLQRQAAPHAGCLAPTEETGR